jgi:two-component system, NtrC family, nitrogen regulation response regulator NtrX
MYGSSPPPTRTSKKEIRQGRFRQDLYYRLNVLPFHVPPLRHRRGDIMLLAEHFLAHFCRQESRASKRFSPEAAEALRAYSWPGNVRELKNVVERLVIMVPHETILAEDLPEGIQGSAAGAKPGLPLPAFDDMTFKQARDEFEREFIQQKLEEFDGNVSRTAEAIDLERSNLHRKIKSYGIELKK